MSARRLAVILIALSPSIAFAAGRDLRSAPKEADTSRGKPAPVKATLAQDDGERDAAADRKRDELIADLQTHIPRLPETDRKADLYFQLAELWWEKARFVSLQEVTEQDDAWAKWSLDRKGDEPKLDNRRSDAHRKQALRLYQLVLERYPRYERRDEVLFVAAHNLYESGRREEGVA